MHPTVPESELIKIEQELESLFLSSDPEVSKYKEEILFVCYASSFVKRVCITQPEWLASILVKDALNQNYNSEQYRQLLRPVFDATSIESLQQKLRKLRTACFARIAWRDLQQYATVQQTLEEQSLFADICLQETLQWCFERLRSRSNASEFVQSLPFSIVVFALGKLGGRELNFSSDVDIVFSYTDDVAHTQEQAGEVVEFYIKVVQLLIKVLSEQTQDGFVFRVDTRLRPFGESGTLLPNFSSIDQYFQTHGRDWERYAWMKARVIAGDIKSGEQFLREVTPFIYRRYLDYGAMQSLREMKLLIDKKARLNIDKEDLKIGIGGIREIEFITQMFQLTYGGKNPTLRIQSTLKALQQLKKQELLTSDWVNNLIAAYVFLRKAENALQLREDQQVHTLPTKSEHREHYASLMNKQNWQEFYTEYSYHTKIVSELFQSILNVNDEEQNETPNSIDIDTVWDQIDEKEYCINVLTKNFSQNADDFYQQLKNFHESSRVKKLIPVARGRLDAFMPIFLQELKNFDEPALVFDRFIKILKQIVQRSTYISLLIENKTKLAAVFSLIQASPWITQYLSTHPLLLDEVLSMDESYEPPSLSEMQNQLEASLLNEDLELERYMDALREFKHSQVIQIAAADIVENYPIMKVSDHLSWLAEVCINSAVNYACNELKDKFGTPQCILKDKTYTPEVLIIEYGKLGGLELGYGSDLDIVFLHNSSGDHCETTGTESEISKIIHNDIFFTRLVQRAIHLLTTITANGKVFETDLRLRPHGESGPIITSITAYEKYLMDDAWLWEHQALVRARPITSSSSLAEKFSKIRKKVLCISRKTEDVQSSVIEMRNKILSANKGGSNSEFNIKKDAGGLIDIEFIVQFLVLNYSHKFPQICEYTDNIRILESCAEAGLIEPSDTSVLKDIYLKYRKYLHQLSLQLLPETAELDQFKDERRVVKKYWASLLNSGST